MTIVDDDQEVRSSLESLMRSAGFSVRGYVQAEEFLSSAEEGKTACIVTDLHMSGMSGLDLQLELRRRGVDVPVIVMTAFPTDNARQQAMAQGAVAFLSKPLDPDLLLDTIEEAVTS